MQAGSAADVQKGLAGQTVGKELFDAGDSRVDPFPVDRFRIILPVFPELEVSFAIGKAHDFRSVGNRPARPQPGMSVDCSSMCLGTLTQARGSGEADAFAAPGWH